MRPLYMAYVPGEDFELWGRLVVKYPIYLFQEKLVRYRWSDEEGKVSGINHGREYAFLNIHMLFRKNYLDYMTDEEFVRYFGNKFIDKQSKTTEELECEKAQILLQCSEINILGIERYEELLRNPDMLNLLENKYQFSLSEYYNEYKKLNFYSAIKCDIERLKQEKEALFYQIKEREMEIEEKQNIIEVMTHSTSWRFTEPLRKIGRILKKKRFK